MKPTIFLNRFVHGTTPLIKLFFFANPQLEANITKLTYVYYSQQYKCHYMRDQQSTIQQLTWDLKPFAFISTKYLNPTDQYKNTKPVYLHNTTPQIGSPTLPPPIVSIVLINEKSYLKLPTVYKKSWVDFLNSQGFAYESKRRFWIVPDYQKTKESLNNYFTSQGCHIKVHVKHNEKIQRHLDKQNYRDDKEVFNFIKLMTLQGAGKRTIENYASQIKKLKNYYDGKPVGDLSDEEIQDYLFFLREELSYSRSAQNIVVSAVKRFLSAFSEREPGSFNLPRPKKRLTLPKTIEKEEVAALLSLNMNTKHKCILYMLYATGIRCGELINLRVEDVNFNRKVITIKNGKGDKSRIVSLPEKLAPLLQTYLRKEQPNDYLFEGQKGGVYSSSSVQKILKKAAENAGIDKHVTPHMLRHSFATHLHDTGMDIRNIQKLLGHSSTKTTQIYTYVSKRDICKLKSPLDDLDL
ncbi:site-specific tyrosine recombinase/integron integrase [Carboxylicivirga taeanensis]|uniref:site-specific tyrosine recombinase/integron integrase n=1 Tax=Carboxylicivirga taeanensis TaxID=1416875 RepID=UPI003F6DBBD5